MPARALRKPGSLKTNTVTFPRKLRDAIPDEPLCAGRVLALESVDACGGHVPFWGRRVQLSLRVKETGKLTGVFDLIADLDLNAAEALSKLIQAAVEQARNAPEQNETGPVYVLKRKR